MLDTTLDEFREGSTSFNEDMNKLLDAFEGVQILGNRGIVMDLGINEDGHIVKQRGYADFVIHTNKVEGALNKASGVKDESVDNQEVNPNITLTLSTDFNYDAFNINKKTRGCVP